MFKDIIAVNRDRILSRLRSKHAARSFKTTNRTPIAVRLAEGIKIVRAFTRNMASASTEFEQIEAKVQEFQRLFNHLEALRGGRSNTLECDNILGSVVKISYSLASRHDLSKYLNSIPNSGTFGPEAKASLPEIIGKLGRYYASCSFLIAAARKLPIFRRIHVESIGIKLPNCPPSSAGTCQPSLLKTINRVLGAGEETRRQSSARSSVINHAFHLKSAENSFLSKLAAPRRSYKIHAEIQLLSFYELHPQLPRPRVICSSKSACFLCDLFIKIHANFFVARTHGVLYDKWSLPDMQSLGLGIKESANMAATVEKFSASIEDSIRRALAIPELLRFHPNESVFMQPPNWSSSAVSASSSTVSATQPQGAEPRLREHDNSSGSAVTLIAPTEWDLRTFKDDEKPSLSQPEPGQTRRRRTAETRSDDEETDRNSVSERSHGYSERVSSLRRSPSSNSFQREAADERCCRSAEQSLCSSGSPVSYSSAAPATEHELNKPGDWIELDLPTDLSSVIVSIESIRLILSSGWAESTDSAVDLQGATGMETRKCPPNEYAIRARWLRSGEDLQNDTDAPVIDLDGMTDNMDETWSHKKNSPWRLYFRRDDHILAVDFMRKCHL